MKKVFLVSIILILSLNFKYYRNAPEEKYWVFFKDKQHFLLKKFNSSPEYQKALVSERSLLRRAKILPSDKLIDETDLPLNEFYLSRLRSLGFTPVAKSRWLNGISLYLSSDERKLIESLPFVEKIERVNRFHHKIPERKQIPLRKYTGSAAHRYNYGESSWQNELIRTPEVHDLGITGKGVLVGMLDTGFNWIHEAFEQTSIITAYDFINRDDTTANQTGQDSWSQEHHGTETLSALGGFKNGELVGAAFGASFAVAKTEMVSREISVEEDLWVEGLEWLDSIGCDVVSSSLGYADFQDVNYYTQDDLDGKTTKVTVAADLAVEKGIVVCNSAGNERNASWGTIIAPADGFNVIAVGSVYSDGSLSMFSSPGPTADGRIKPDICAMGSYVYVAYPGNFSSYIYSSGTSYSCPLAAGAAALILSAHPELTPFQVKNALKNTASRHDNPDNNFGWGIIDVYEALLSCGIFFSNEPVIDYENGKFRIEISVASKYGISDNSVKIFLSFTEGVLFQEYVMTPSEIDNRYYFDLPEFRPGQNLNFYFFAEDKNGGSRYYGGDTAEKSFSVLYGETKVNRPAENGYTPHIPEKIALYQNFPNPFNNSTIIKLDLPEDAFVELKIFDVMGREIKTVINKEIDAGIHYYEWKGTNPTGTAVSSGIYFARAKIGNTVKTVKMTLLK